MASSLPNLVDNLAEINHGHDNKKLKRVVLNAKIVSVVLNTQTLKMIINV